jgi:uncharacterized protein YqjF (DUF2071 family)
MSLLLLAEPLPPEPWDRRQDGVDPTVAWVRCQVTNQGKEPVAFFSLDCMWMACFSTSLTSVWVVGGDCFRNRWIRIRLVPGESYTQMVPLCIADSRQKHLLAPGTRVVLRMRFETHFVPTSKSPAVPFRLESTPITLEVGPWVPD